MFSRFSRRQFISVISLSIAGAAVAGSFPFLKNSFIGKAQAQEISEEVYNRPVRNIKLGTKKW
jgi:hypothetical protein